jgi:predicted PurR-regulated permease PerM
MTRSNYQFIFYIVLLIGVAVFFFFIAAPFISAIFLAIITAVFFQPIHQRIVKRFNNQKNLPSIVSTAIVLALIFIPVIFIANLVVRESATLYSNIQDTNIDSGTITQIVKPIETYVESKIPGLDIKVDQFLDLDVYVKKGFVWFSQHVASFFSGILNLTFGLFIYILCLFYVFREGHLIFKNILAWSPLFDTQDTIVLNKISAAVNSVLRGQLMVGLIQGGLTGLGFWIFGLQNPVIWGVVAAIASLIPAVGTSLINIPAIIFLLVTGSLPQAFGLLVWAILAVGLVDNILGPHLMKRGVTIHPFLILISVLGGLSFFGPIGFIAGPVVLSLLFALLDLYPTIVRTATHTTDSK